MKPKFKLTQKQESIAKISVLTIALIVLVIPLILAMMDPKAPPVARPRASSKTSSVDFVAPPLKITTRLPLKPASKRRV